MNNALLEQGLLKLGLAADRSLQLLLRYIDEIELFNPAYGLVKVENREELIVRHILDSLAPLGAITACLQGTPVPVNAADIGSGAGLPGIPLAICMQNAGFTLVERMGRRAGFLRDVLAVLCLNNAKVAEAEMEKLSLPDEARFTFIVFRALSPLEPNLVKRLFRLLAPGGFIAAYKGRRSTIDEEMAKFSEAAQKAKAQKANNEAARVEIPSWEIVPVEVPFLEEERHLLVLRH